MRIPRIHTEQPLRPGSLVELETRAANHLVQVLRLRTGTELILFNGDGHDYPGRLEQASRRSVVARVESRSPAEPTQPLSIHLAIGVSKGERFDFAIQKAVELGVMAITPLFTDRSVIRLDGERLEKRMAHWRNVIVAACEQSGRARLPALDGACALTDWIGDLSPGARLLLDHRSADGLPNLPPPQGGVLLLIGPEGGLAEPERGLATRHGFRPVRLGPRVLRTETAPLAAIAAIQVLWGDLR